MKNLTQLEQEIQTLRLNLMQSSNALVVIRVDADDLANCQIALNRCREALDQAQRSCEIALDEIPW